VTHSGSSLAGFLMRIQGQDGLRVRNIEYAGTTSGGLVLCRALREWGINTRTRVNRAALTFIEIAVQFQD
jgi:hypothetical protein